MKYVFALLVLGMAGAGYYKMTTAKKRKVSSVAVATPKPYEKKEGVVAIRIAGGKLALKVTTSPLCSLGDFDAIKSELQKKPSAKILLSVERLDGKTPPLFVEEIPFSQLGSAGVKAVKLAPQPAQLGVFVCLDTVGQRRCLGKEAVDINKVFEPPASGQRYVDKIIFFQYVLFDGADEGFALADFQASPQDEAELQRRATQSIRATDAEAIKGEVQKAAELIRTLRSAALSPEKDAVHISLPKMDLKICTTGTGKPLEGAHPIIPLPSPSPSPMPTK